MEDVEPQSTRGIEAAGGADSASRREKVQGLARLSGDAVGAVPRILRHFDDGAARRPPLPPRDRSALVARGRATGSEARRKRQRSTCAPTPETRAGAAVPRSARDGGSGDAAAGHAAGDVDTSQDSAGAGTCRPHTASSALEVMTGIVFGAAPLPRSLCGASALVCVQGKTRARIAAAVRRACFAALRPASSVANIQRALRPLCALGKGNYAAVYASAVSVGGIAGEAAARRPLPPHPLLPPGTSEAECSADSLDVPVAVKQIVDEVDKFCSQGGRRERRNLRRFDLALAVREARMLNVGAAIVALGACPAFPIPFCSLLVGGAPAAELNRAALACERNDPPRQHDADAGSAGVAGTAADESLVAAVVIVMQRATQTLREWVRNRAEEQVAPLLVQALLGVSAAALFGASHNDLYDRNVLTADVDDVVLSVTMPSGNEIRLRTRCDDRSPPQLALLSDWGIATARQLGPLPEARATACACAQEEGGGADLTHAVDYDFDVRDTMTAAHRREVAAALEAASDCVEARDAAEHTARAGRIKRSAAFAAAAKRRSKTVHVMLARGMPVWARDVVALVSSVRDVVRSRQGAVLLSNEGDARDAVTATPWMDGVMRALESAVASDRLDAPHKIASFVEFICSSDFCAHAGCPGVRRLFQANCADGVVPVLHYDLRLIKRHADLLNAVAARNPFEEHGVSFPNI